MEENRWDNKNQYGDGNPYGGDTNWEYMELERQRQQLRMQEQAFAQKKGSAGWGFVKGIIAGSALMLVIMSVVVIVCSVNYRIILVPTSGNFAWEESGKDDSEETDGKSGKKSTVEAMISKITLLKQYVDKYYLYDVDGIDYVDGIYKGMISSLDDVYSVYYTKEEYAKLMEQTKGNYCGLGAYVQQDPDTGNISVVKVIRNSAAEEIGMETGDIIYAVDGKKTSGEDISTVVSWLKGEEGTTAELEYYRNGKLLKDTIVRKQVETESVEYEMLEGNTGYIGVTTFADNTPEQFHDALEDLKKQGAEGIIIDLRDNGGGLLGACIEMANCILEDGVIVSTKTKAGEEEVYSANGKESLNLPVIILINGNSASASEVFSGALKDNGKAVLMGTKSFGKGIVQTVLPLEDGSALKLTTSEYFTPSGKNIQDIGIEPDIKVELDTEALKDGYKKENDNQLNEALKEMEKMTE